MKNLILLILALVFAGCNYSRIKGGANSDLGDLSSCGPIDFATVNELVISQKCLECHRPGLAYKGVLLDTFANVQANAARAREQVEANKMPDGKPLDSDDKKFLLAWFDQGAREKLDGPSVRSCAAVPGDVSSAVPSEPPPVDEPPVAILPLEASYDSIRQNIFAKDKKRCLSCHDSTAPSLKPKYDFSSYETMITYTSLFNLGNPSDSKFIEPVMFGLMPPGGPFLSNEEIAVLTDWIGKGLPKTLGGPPGILFQALPPVTPVTVPTTPGPEFCADDYTAIKTNVLEVVCLRCHGLAIMPALNTYKDIQDNIFKIGKSVRLDRMPKRWPKTMLPAEQQALKVRLLKWIDNGAPEKVDAANCVTQ